MFLQPDRSGVQASRINLNECIKMEEGSLTTKIIKYWFGN